MIRAHLIALLLCSALQVGAYAVQYRWPWAGVLAGWTAALIYMQLIKGIQK